MTWYCPIVEEKTVDFTCQNIRGIRNLETEIPEVLRGHDHIMNYLLPRT